MFLQLCTFQNFAASAQPGDFGPGLSISAHSSFIYTHLIIFILSIEGNTSLCVIQGLLSVGFFNKTTKSRTKNVPLEQKQFFHRWSSVVWPSRFSNWNNCLIMNSSRAFSFSRRPIVRTGETLLHMSHSGAAACTSFSRSTLWLLK